MTVDRLTVQPRVEKEKGVIVISSGFAEVGNAEDEKKLKEFVDQHHIALLGPNVLGLMYAPSRLNATFGPRKVLPGKIAFISQSGAWAIALMGWTVMEKIGLAALVSVGNKTDISDQELIEYFNNDDHVKVIQIYMEGIKDGRRFMQTKVKKPIVVLKVGRSITFAEDKIKAVIILYCETVITDPLQVADIIEEEYEKIQRRKPLIVAMVGGDRTRQAIHYLNENHVPAFTTISEAVSALKVLYTWRDISRRPEESAEAAPPRQVISIIGNAKAEQRNALFEHEALTVLGGVALNIHNEEELALKFSAMIKQIRSARPEAKIRGVQLMEMVRGIECVAGLSHDPQFGPVVMFGLGGVFVEALKNVSFRVVPFGRLEAQRLIDEIRGAEILKGFRGIAAERVALIDAVCSVQKLASHVREVDINPLIVNEKGCFAVDARVIL